jgi:hypothetical protein
MRFKTATKWRDCLLGGEDPVVLTKELSFGNPFFRRWYWLGPDPPVGLAGG